MNTAKLGGEWAEALSKMSQKLINLCIKSINTGGVGLQLRNFLFLADVFRLHDLDFRILTWGIGSKGVNKN